MLRAISEIAVASSVWSVLGMSSPIASERARWRAVTTSASDWIAIRSTSSSAKVTCLQERETLLEVERGLHVLETHPELDHGEGHLGLDPDDHRLRAAQSRHVSDPAQRSRRKGVHHVQRRDVHDDPARAEPSDLLDKVVLELEDVAVAECRLNGGDQIVP